MDISVKVKNAAVSPYKARLVADAVRGMPVEKAGVFLTFCNKKSASIIKSALDNAISNAENNFNANVDELKIKSIVVDQGITIKRMQPRAKGRSNRIFRRRSHISITLST